MAKTNDLTELVISLGARIRELEADLLLAKLEAEDLKKKLENPEALK
jgi:hypothetical protein